MKKHFLFCFFYTMTTLGICEQQLGCEPYICGNVDTGTVEEMSKQLPAKSVVMLELQ